ncbi:uncharacterized protein Z518_09315 [Rhinocladiella mackenziei CBS 650.93]|uniref:Uncharacterized protein n=1 Tax=Rhinocladiella mackenziei CBS 650.93 TaxID=1442369 RepID=A0A0D2I6Z9_9EURO|nr:uncharacterized protein Z518_09315 [Rhinocladiella mackenziei CBS 650.93]KIX01589.1 hypothetical protein Z518_09315 [Rhinocladiella mackenziei CBS 650.93]
MYGVAPLETIGLFGFAWTSLGPDYGIPWIAPMIAASATGGNDLARDFLAGIAALYSAPFYENIGKKYVLEYPSTVLACLSVVVIIPIYLFYWKGEWFRNRSKFAKELNAGRKDAVERRRSSAAALRNRRTLGTASEKDGMRHRASTHAEDVRHIEQV